MTLHEMEKYFELVLKYSTWVNVQYKVEENSNTSPKQITTHTESVLPQTVGWRSCRLHRRPLLSERLNLQSDR